METEFDTPDIEQRNAVRGAQILQIESSRLVPVLVALSAIGLVLAGLGVGLSCWALSYADKARMESRILQVKVEGFENALHAQGIDPAPHLPGQGN
jgi:hypothetical protein